MTIDQLKYFFEVAHCLNFSKAAQNLYIAQPNLTKQISKLEQEIGFRLFDRGTHHCCLTEDGVHFLRQTEDLFFQLNTRIEDTKLRNKNLFRQFYIGIAPAEPPVPPMMKLIQTFNRSNPSCRLILQQDSYVNLIDKLENHDFDLLITTDRNARRSPNFDYVMLAPFELMLAVHNSNPKTQKKNLRPQDCQDEIAFFSLPDGKHAPPSCFDDFNHSTGGNMNLTVLPSPADLMNNVIACSGVGLVPSTVDQSLYPDVTFYHFEVHGPGSGQALLWRNTETNPILLQIIRQVKEQFPQSS